MHADYSRGACRRKLLFHSICCCLTQLNVAQRGVIACKDGGVGGRRLRLKDVPVEIGRRWLGSAKLCTAAAERQETDLVTY
jgi:hypothetical protein